VARRILVEGAGSVETPATPEEIASLRRRAAERRLTLDQHYLNAFLPYSNGIVINGLSIPGAQLTPHAN